MAKSLSSKMNFGKYKNYTIEEILEIAPPYIEWALDTITKFELDDRAMEKYEKAIALYYKEDNYLDFE